MGDCTKIANDGYTELTEAMLKDVGPGCFILKKGSSGSCYWAEVISMNDTVFECIAHPELTADFDSENISAGDKVYVKREQIRALGCDRYCFC